MDVLKGRCTSQLPESVIRCAQSPSVIQVHRAHLENVNSYSRQRWQNMASEFRAANASPPLDQHPHPLKRPKLGVSKMPARMQTVVGGP